MKSANPIIGAFGSDSSKNVAWNTTSALFWNASCVCLAASLKASRRMLGRSISTTLLFAR